MGYPPLRPSRPFGMPNTPFNPMTGKFLGFGKDDGGNYVYEGPFKVVDITVDGDSRPSIRVENNGNRVILNGRVFPCPEMEEELGNWGASENVVNYTGVYLNVTNPPYYTLAFVNFGAGGEEVNDTYIDSALLAVVGVKGVRKSTGGAGTTIVPVVDSIIQVQSGEISRGSTMIPAMVTGNNGALHQVALYPDGVGGGQGEQATVMFMQLDMADTIPTGTWVLVHQSSYFGYGSGVPE